MKVRLVIYHDLGGEGDPYHLQLKANPTYFVVKDKGYETERFKVKFTTLSNCRIAVEVVSGKITKTKPETWPASFGPDSEFVIGIWFPLHRQELRGAVVGAGACSGTTPNYALERTRGG
jgi:hypothetical protein